ncbi:MAG: YybH family protein [Gammaproteobacteria bacterium]
MEENKLFSTSDEAEKAFYAAFQQQDVELMMSVWSEGDDVTCIHPGGTRLEGQSNIRESWEQIFRHENDIKFEINQKRIQIEEQIAIHHVIESIYMDGELQSEIIATNVYRKSYDSWHIVLHHASPELRPAIDQLESEEEILEEETKTFH